MGAEGHHPGDEGPYRQREGEWDPYDDRYARERARRRQRDRLPGYDPAREFSRSAVWALVLGIIGLVVCGIVAPFAWIYGNGAVDDARGTPQEGLAQAGRILGIIGTVGWVAAMVYRFSQL